MCNPRRVRVRATRQLAQAWQHEVRRSATRIGTAVGEARVREPLASTVGAPALAALESVLEETEGWLHHADDDTYRFAMDGGSVIYHPGSQDLEIVATASAEVEGSAEAAATVHGELTGDLEAEGEGMYYDDHWGGRTEVHAERDARDAAERALDEAGREREELEHARAEEREGDAVAEAAAQRAEADLTARAAARSAQLRADATVRMTAIGIQGRNAFNQALAAAYGRAILAYARTHGAEAIRHSERGGIVDIEFELER